MQTEFITTNKKETQALGTQLAKELRGGEVLCLIGELGAGKTTFTQGLLEALGAEKPFTSPTFVVMKEYILENKKKKNTQKTIQRICHFDAYRLEEKDFSTLGWEEIICDQHCVSIVEWADRITKIVPKKRALWIKFEWIDEDRRKIILAENKNDLAKTKNLC